MCNSFSFMQCFWQELSMRRNLRCRPLLPSLFTYILTSPQPGERPSQLEVIIYPLSHTSQIRNTVLRPSSLQATDGRPARPSLTYVNVIDVLTKRMVWELYSEFVMYDLFLVLNLLYSLTLTQSLVYWLIHAHSMQCNGGFQWCHSDHGCALRLEVRCLPWYDRHPTVPGEWSACSWCPRIHCSKMGRVYWLVAQHAHNQVVINNRHATGTNCCV